MNWLFGQRTPGNPFVVLPNRKVYAGLNRLIWKLDEQLPQHLRESSRQEMEEMINHKVGKYYADSNHRTMEITGLDLAHYGYDL